MQFNSLALAVSAFAVLASATDYNSTQPAGTAAVAPSASGVGSSPGATGSPISGVNGAVGMSILSGSALSLIVAGGVALAF